MPGGDRTGPMGMGPRTGRAAGFCSGYGFPGYANFGPGRWFRRGGWWPGGFGYPGAASHPGGYVDEKEYLKEQAASIKEELNALEARLKELESKEENE